MCENVFFVVIFPSLNIFGIFFFSDFRVQHTPYHNKTPFPSKSEGFKKIEKNQFLAIFGVFAVVSPHLNIVFNFIFCDFRV